MLNTSLCYIEKDSQYLMLHRIKKEHDYNKDKWIGIGGKFEEGESPEECARREVLEETGLSIGILEYRGLVTFLSYDENDELFTEFMHLFWTNDFSGDLIDCNEGHLEWVPKVSMNKLPHWKGDEIFLELLDSTTSFFSLKLVYKCGILIKAVLNEKNLDI